jgi:hypothetical protein
MRYWQWLVVTRLGSLCLAGYVFWLGWQHLEPRKPEVGPARRWAVAETVPAIVADIRANRQGIQSAVILHLVNDPSDTVTDSLRSAMERTGVLDLYDRSFLEKARAIMLLRQPASDSAPRALRVARRRGADAAIFGAVHVFESGPQGVALDLEVSLADTASGQVVWTKRYTRQMTAGSAGQPSVPSATPKGAGLTRVLAWAVLVLLLPVFSITFIRTMVRKSSNRINAFVLAIYTAVDAILAWLMVGASLVGGGAIVAFVGGVAVAAAYNVFVMTFALRLEET